MSDDSAFERIRANLRHWDEDAVELGLREFQRRREAHSHVEGSVERVRSSLRRWGSDEIETGLAEFHFRRGEGRNVQRRLGLGLGALGAAAVIALVAAALLTGRDQAPVAAKQARTSAGAGLGAPPAEAASEAGDRRVSLDDGSELTLIGRESEARVVESAAHRVVVAMNAGRATFRVRHRPERVFVVQVGSVQLEDLGTVFHVARGTTEVSVNVVEGAVQVTWPKGVERLEAGSHRTYPLAGASASDASKPAAVQQPSAAASAAPVARSGGFSDGQAWRTAAREGRFGPAFQLLQAEGLGNVRDEPNDLLLAADVARLSGHAGDAVEPLRRLLRNHRGDPRSPAAAFTLGSVLLRDLGRPREAVAAFLEVQRLAPAGNLAEDAEARAAEAWYRAGEQARAEAARLRYGARYPQGRHLAFLKNLIQNKR